MNRCSDTSRVTFMDFEDLRDANRAAKKLASGLTPARRAGPQRRPGRGDLHQDQERARQPRAGEFVRAFPPRHGAAPKIVSTKDSRLGFQSSESRGCHDAVQPEQAAEAWGTLWTAVVTMVWPFMENPVENGCQPSLFAATSDRVREKIDGVYCLLRL